MAKGLNRGEKQPQRYNGRFVQECEDQSTTNSSDMFYQT